MDFPGGSDGKESAYSAETQVWSLGQEGLLEKGTATHSRILAWEIPQTEEPGGLLSIGSQRVGCNQATKQQQQCLSVANLHSSEMNADDFIHINE